MTGSRHDYTLNKLLQEVSIVTNCFSGGSDSCPSHQECVKFQDNYFSRGHNQNMEEICNNDINLSVSNVRALPDSGLASMDHEALREFISPIFKCLSTINAEELLALERVNSGGAHLGNGFGVRPIHDFIHPPKHEYKNDSCVRYLHIAEVEGSYSIGIFVFPPHAHMPLHDHPDMCVLSRILYGEVVKTALDLERENMPQQRESWISNVLWSNSNNNKLMSPAKNAKRARKTATELLKAPDVTTLFPYEGNLHEFVAGPQGAAILDVLLPPYGNSRDCTFYNIHEDGTHSESCWVVPTGQPESFHCLSGRYRNLGRDDSMDEEFEGQDNNS